MIVGKRGSQKHLRCRQVVLGALCWFVGVSAVVAAPWARHAIDDASRGADGVRLADFNDDGLMDVVTAWEEGGVVRLCLHPGAADVRRRWPGVTVGRVGSGEDAAPVDVDGDGRIDMVSCCEGNVRSIFVHWAPREPSRLLDADAWRTEPLPASVDRTRWMFALPGRWTGDGVELLVGSKNDAGQIGLLSPAEPPRDLAAWRYRKLRDAAWIMSLVGEDIDRDNDVDLLFSDRRGPRSGVFWLENPGANAGRAAWVEHPIGGRGREVMFLDVADVDGNGRRDVLAAVKPADVLVFHRPADPRQPWPTQRIAVPAEMAGTAKAVRAGDLDLDGRIDLAFSCEGAVPPKSGVVWAQATGAVADGAWRWQSISGPVGVKFDLIELIDLDGDGDLDLLTCEERRNLGVVWYENPTR